MAYLSGGIYSLLTGTAEVAAIVGTDVYHSAVPQDQGVPYVAYHKVDRETEETMGGAASTEPHFFQTDCWADTDAGAQALAAAVYGAMRGYSGTAGGVEINAIFLAGEGRDYIDREGVRWFRVWWRWKVWATGVVL